MALPVVCSQCRKVQKLIIIRNPDGRYRTEPSTDKITQVQPLQSQQPNGFTIQLFEEGKSENVPIVIPGKADGTFENGFISSVHVIGWWLWKADFFL